MAREPDRDTVGTRVVGGGGQAEIAETPLEVDEKFSGFWYRFFGIERIGEAALVAVRGMNCATPCAPAGLMTSARKLLSRQISRVRNATGSP